MATPLTVGKLFRNKLLTFLLAIVVIPALAVISQMGSHPDALAAIRGTKSSGLS